MDMTILDKLGTFIGICDAENDEVLYVNIFGLDKLGLSSDDLANLKGDDINIGGIRNETIITYDGKKAKLVTYLDDGKQNREEKFLIRCMKSVYNHSDTDEFINTMLNIIMEYYDADKVFIYELSSDNSQCKKSYEVYREGCEDRYNADNSLSKEKIEFWRSIFTQNKFFVVDSENNADQTNEKYDYIFGGQFGKNLKKEINASLRINDTRFGSVIVINPKTSENNLHFLVNVTYFIANEIQKRRIFEKLEYMSFFDPLTKLKNRNSYSEYIKDYDKSVKDSLGVAYIDVNGLKNINEQYGQDYGDILVSSVADLLKHQLIDVFRSKGEKMEVFRMDGEEFLIIWENCDYDVFTNAITSLEGVLLHNEEELITCGYLWSDECGNLGKIVAKADELMHIKKHKYYERHINSRAHTPALLSKLLKGIADGEYTIYLQPKSSIKKGGEVYGAEALIRYIDKEKGMIPPYKFIPLLEREKIISYIDFFVFEEVCKLLNTWSNEGTKKMVVSLNFSRISLMESDFVERIENIAKKYNIDKDCLELEVTETSETLDRVRMIEVMNQLKAKGFRISLDDFGCEYSSMDMLLAFDIDVIKIDKSLIDELTISNKNKIIVRHICQMGSDMGIETIAEGVETIDQYNLLKGIGCENIQGYLFGKPMPVSDFEEKYLKKIG